jgi:hypothetical protein
MESDGKLIGQSKAVHRIVSNLHNEAVTSSIG